MRQTKQFLALTRAVAKRSLIAMLVATLTMTTACEKPILNERVEDMPKTNATLQVTTRATNDDVDDSREYTLVPLPE